MENGEYGELLLFLLTIMIIGTQPSLFGEVFVWETASIVYPHMLLLALFFLNIYVSDEKTNINTYTKTLRTIGMFLLGICVGGGLEHLAPTILLGCGIMSLGLDSIMLLYFSPTPPLRVCLVPLCFVYIAICINLQGFSKS